MKKFFKTFALMAALISCALFAACGKDKENKNPDEYVNIDAETAYNENVRSGLAFFNSNQNKQFTLAENMSIGQEKYVANFSTDLESETFVMVGKQNDEITNRIFSVHSNNYVRVYDYEKVEVEQNPEVELNVKNKTYIEYSKLSAGEESESEWATYWQHFLNDDTIIGNDMGLKSFTQYIPAATETTTYQDFLNGLSQNATATGKKYQDGRIGLSISCEVPLGEDETTITITCEYIVKDGKLVSLIQNQGSGLSARQLKIGISYSFTDADIPTDLDAYEFNNFESFDNEFFSENDRDSVIKYLQNVYNYVIQSEFVELDALGTDDLLYLTKEQTYSTQTEEGKTTKTWMYIDSNGAVQKVEQVDDGTAQSTPQGGESVTNMVDYYLSNGFLPLSELNSNPEILTNWQVEGGTITLTITTDESTTLVLTIQNSLIVKYQQTIMHEGGLTLDVKYPTQAPTIPPIPQMD